MKDSNYGKVEEILYGIPKLKAEIENLKIDLEEIQEVRRITVLSGNEKAGSQTYKIVSSVEDEVINRDENLADRIKAIELNIQRKERQIKRVENVLATLTEQEKLLIEMKYFKRYSVNRICEILDITTPTFNLRRRNIMDRKLVPLFLVKGLFST